MDSLVCRAFARWLKPLALAALLPLHAAIASDDPAPLQLTEAARLAATRQPLIEAQRHAARAASDAAVAARQLPDPTLIAGVADVPMTGPDRYSASRDGETEYQLGIRQSFPAAGKRRLRGARGEAQAARLAAEVGDTERMARRDASLAWLDVWKAVEAQGLVTASIAEARRQEQAVEIAYRAGRASQADLMAARIGTELLGDQLANLEQQEWHGRNQLRRWLGDDADRALAVELPAWTAPDRDALLEHLARHPHVSAQDEAVRVAQADVDLAKADYRPDWSVQLGYGHHPDYEDYASVQFELGLPVFTGRRQDRAAAARTAQLGQAESLREDWLKQHRAEIQLNVADWQRLQQRLARYDGVILPAAQQRLDVAMAAYAAGGGSLVSLLDARRSLLEIRMQRLDLVLDASRHQVTLEYFNASNREEQP